ncbi:MAG: sugar phosphate isomerase/epimerase family protein [Candidatus Latescibacterota bacterium]|nr:sugar phosphate isomerase/epimerase family protein [Candidatus Latescibacterota bacterium]
MEFGRSAALRGGERKPVDVNKYGFTYLGAIAPTTPRERSGDMKLGLSTLLFRDRPLNGDLLRDLRDAEVESVELTDYHPGFSFADEALFHGLRGEMRALGLHLNSLHIHLEKSDHDLDLTDLAQQEKTLSAYGQAVDAMEAMGGGILVTHDIRIPEPQDEGHEEKRDTFVEHLDKLARYARPKGVRFALENTSRGYTCDPARLVGLMDQLGGSNVGVVIDTGHQNLAGDPVAALRTAGPHLMTLHIHDNHGEQDEHLLPGLGNIAWPSIVQMLRNVGYQGVFMYELNRPEDLDKLRQNFERLGVSSRSSAGSL